MTRIAVLDDYQRLALECADWSAVLGRAEVVAFADHLADEDAVIDRLRGFDAVVLMRERTPLGEQALHRLPQLRLIVTTGMANAAVDIAAATRLGIAVCGTGLDETPTVELTWALLMALARSVPQEDAAVRAGGWQTTAGRELAGATLGIAGWGRIGRRIGAIATAFGMRVLTWSRSLEPGNAPAPGVEAVAFDELFDRSDIVSVHLRLVPETRGLIGARELALLGPDGLLVNTSRGPIVDEQALVAALEAGTIAGAALDVFDTEPLPAGHPLRSAPRTVLSPHAGYTSREAMAAMYAEAVEDVLAWLDGAPIRVIAG